VTEVDGGNLEILALDVFPDIHLGPVGEGEDTHVFARVEAPVIKIPDLGTLIFGIPLAETVAEAEEALFGPGFFLITSGPSNAGVEAVLLDGG
jgi:hypothetical protein